MHTLSDCDLAMNLGWFSGMTGPVRVIVDALSRILEAIIKWGQVTKLGHNIIYSWCNEDLWMYYEGHLKNNNTES